MADFMDRLDGTLGAEGDERRERDNIPFLMGLPSTVCPNLLSAYGLEKNGPANSAEAQAISIEFEDELQKFYNPAPAHSMQRI